MYCHFSCLLASTRPVLIQGEGIKDLESYRAKGHGWGKGELQPVLLADRWYLAYHLSTAFYLHKSCGDI